MPTLISGSTGVNKITDGTIANADIASDAAIAGSKLVMPTGSVLQVVHSDLSSQTNISSSGFADISLSANITPSATSSKILVTSNVQVYLNGTGFIMLRLMRDSTAIATQYQAHGYSDNSAGMVPIITLDSPSTTSAITYSVQAGEDDFSGTLRINQWGTGGSGKSTLTLMEIAG